MMPLTIRRGVENLYFKSSEFFSVANRGDALAP